MAAELIVLGRPGIGVPPRLGTTDPTPVFIFLRIASLSLDSDMLGEPGRFSLFFLAASALCLPEGVVLPFVFAPEDPESFWSAFLDSSSSLPSSLRSSDSSSSES